MRPTIWWAGRGTTYIYKNEDGADLIWDEDGQGHIEYDSATLSGGRGRSRNSRVFYGWREVPEEIAVLPELTSSSTARLGVRSAVRSGAEDGGIASRRDQHTLGRVQMTGVGIERTAAEESQSAQDGETKAVNDSLWRNAA